MGSNLTASDLRRFSVRCAADAAKATDEGERERLTRMSAALLQLAHNEAWLSGNWRAHPDLQNDPKIQELLDRIAGGNSSHSGADR